MSTIAEEGNSKRMFIKGAPEKVLEKCTKFRQFGQAEPKSLTSEMRSKLNEQIEDLAS